LKPEDIAYSKFVFLRPPKVFGIGPLNLLKLRSLKNKSCSEKVLLKREKMVSETTQERYLVLIVKKSHIGCEMT
jgi:hypothetical protein